MDAVTSAAYLAGLIDGQGSVVCRFRNSEKGWNRHVVIWITDEGLQGVAVERLRAVGITAKVYRQSRPSKGGLTQWMVQISGREDLERLASAVGPFMQDTKRGKLLALLQSYAT